MKKQKTEKIGKKAALKQIFRI